ncbi:MAG: hypothetical protein LBG65_06910 [Puniceicoccales bacterium]|nr:hypothetical protein [Puniceicoccales bacterium]
MRRLIYGVEAARNAIRGAVHETGVISHSIRLGDAARNKSHAFGVAPKTAPRPAQGTPNAAAGISPGMHENAAGIRPGRPLARTGTKPARLPGNRAGGALGVV